MELRTLELQQPAFHAMFSARSHRDNIYCISIQ
jgi:hypothetical protein